MTLEENFGQQSRDEHPKTFAGLEEGQEYVHCPQCEGDGQVHAYWDPDEPSWSDYISCPCCGGTREASDENAIAWLEAERDRKGWHP